MAAVEPAASGKVLPLFRAEALAHVGARGYGSVVLARPPSDSFLTTLFAGIAIVLVVFFGVFSYHRKVQVAGVLLPVAGLLRVAAPQAGIVVDSRVHEGQAVRAGQTLLVLNSARASSTLGDTERVVTTLLQGRRDSLQVDRAQVGRQYAQRMDAAVHKADGLVKEIARLDAQATLQERRVALAEESLKRFADLENGRFISRAQTQDKQAELLDQRQRSADLERSRAAAARDLASVRADLQDQRVQAQREQQSALRSIAAIEQDLTENEARREIVVRAPQDGVVTAVSAESGQAVAAGRPLLSIVPSGTPLQAELYAPSRAAGFLRPGMDVLLRYQAYPYQKFGQHHGRIREVSDSAMRPEDAALPGATSQPGAAIEPFYRVRVTLDEQAVTTYGERQPLKSGMALEASVLLETRRLYEWVLEPLYTITGRL